MMTMIRPSSPTRKKATRTSPTLSATSAATKRLEIDPELCSGFCNQRVAQGALDKLRGHSSAGRALAWHARGRRFDPAWLHHASPFGLRVAQPRGALRAKRGARRSPKGEAGLVVGINPGRGLKSRCGTFTSSAALNSP